MRFNFWQWLGLALLVICGGLWVFRMTTQHTTEPKGTPTTPTSQSAPATQAVAATGDAPATQSTTKP